MSVVETGADINLICENCLRDDIIMNSSHVKILSGIGNMESETMGSVVGKCIC